MFYKRGPHRNPSMPFHHVQVPFCPHYVYNKKGTMLILTGFFWAFDNWLWQATITNEKLPLRDLGVVDMGSSFFHCVCVPVCVCYNLLRHALIPCSLFQLICVYMISYCIITSTSGHKKWGMPAIDWNSWHYVTQGNVFIATLSQTEP